MSTRVSLQQTNKQIFLRRFHHIQKKKSNLPQKYNLNVLSLFLPTQLLYSSPYFMTGCSTYLQHFSSQLPIFLFGISDFTLQ